MKRRILLLMAVVALMVAMLAMAVASAFAAPSSPCPGKNGNIVSASQAPDYDKNNNGLICRYDRYDQNFNLVSTRYKDDRQFL
jgi:hypothetical protein